MTDRFPRAFALLRVHEGGYSNHPRDPGGATMKGVTQRTYDAYRRRNGQAKRDVRQITNTEVETIYRGQYWDAVKADDLPAGVAYCVFDAAVNSGPGRAARWLQELVGVKVDGIVGNETVSAVRAVSAVDLIRRYCANRLAFMKRLKHWSAFKNGWTRRVAEVEAQSLKWANDQGIPDSKYQPQPKAEGPEKVSTTFKDAMKDPGAIGAVGGLLGGAGTLTQGDGPAQYAVAAVLILGAMVGVWWLVRGRK